MLPPDPVVCRADGVAEPEQHNNKAPQQLHAILMVRDDFQPTIIAAPGGIGVFPSFP